MIEANQQIDANLLERAMSYAKSQQSTEATGLADFVSKTNRLCTTDCIKLLNKILYIALAEELLIESIPNTKDVENINDSESLITRLTIAFQNINKGPIVLNALPKSGGSWFSILLSYLCGFHKVKKTAIKMSPPYVTPTYKIFHSQFTDFTVLKDDSLTFYRNKPALMHTHLVPNRDTIDAIVSMGGNVIFLERDLRDVVVSLYHHLIRRDGEISTILHKLDNASGLTYVIDTFIPEFAAYLSEWRELAKNRHILTLRYENLLDDTEHWVNRVFAELDFYIPERYKKTVIQTFDRRNLCKCSNHNLISSGLKFRNAQPHEWKGIFMPTHCQRFNLALSKYTNLSDYLIS